jgi:hypothetical protein
VVLAGAGCGQRIGSCFEEFWLANAGIEMLNRFAMVSE